MAKWNTNVLIHGALVFFVGIGIGAAITYVGFEGNFSDYRKAEFKGQQLEVDRYLQMLENPRTPDIEVREDLKTSLKNKVQYLKEMEKTID